ncbi:YihY/virulence factor BrkB family protein [Salana multivorans]
MKAWITEKIAWGQKLWLRIQQTRLWRMNTRYGSVRAAQLAGGIAYAGLLSVFAALAIAFTVFMRLLSGRPEILDAVVGAIDEALPGVMVTADNPNGLLEPSQLVVGDGGLSLTTVIAVVTLLLSALGVMGALASSLRAVFGIVAPPGNVVVSKLRDLGGFVLLGTAVLATAALGIGAGTAGAWVTQMLGLESSFGALLVRGLGILAAFAVDTLVFAALIRFVAGARPLPRDLWLGAGIGAVGTGALRLLGTSVVGGASDNPVLASAVGLVTLLLWMNLAARIALYVAAFTANPPAPPVGVAPSQLHAAERPNYVTLSAPHTLAWDHDARSGAVLPTEAERLEREAQQRAQEQHQRELEAALDAALERPESWWAKRRRLRAARKAVREQR